MRQINSLVAVACLASLSSPARGEKMSYRDYPDANRGRQIGGALLLNREDKAWLHEPSLTDMIAKCAAVMSDVKSSPVACQEASPLPLKLLPPPALAAKCEPNAGSAAEGGMSESELAVVLVVAGDLQAFDPLETKAFDADTDEAMALAAGGRHTW